MRSSKRRIAMAASAALALGLCFVGVKVLRDTSHPVDTGFTAAQVPARAPLRVMPLGDSITYGYTPNNPPGGYRDDLWQLFRADARPVKFVGSQQDGPPYLGDKHHEGWLGWRIDEILNGRQDQQKGFLVQRLKTYRPDVVLLHIGTNDILQNHLVGAGSKDMASRLATLISTITKTLPKTTVYAATIGPFANPGMEREAVAYNARIPGIVSATGPRAHLVDVHQALTTADLAEGVHPTTGGYSKIARTWYSAIISAPLNRSEAESPANTLHGAEVVVTQNASGNKKVGHIDHPGDYLQFKVTGARQGRYRLYVRAGNGTSTVCSHRVSVDGQRPWRLSYPNYGWDQWAIVAADVSLHAGLNTIRFSHDQCFAEIDSIDLAPH